MLLGRLNAAATAVPVAAQQKALAAARAEPLGGTDEGQRGPSVYPIILTRLLWGRTIGIAVRIECMTGRDPGRGTCKCDYCIA